MCGDGEGYVAATDAEAFLHFYVVTSYVASYLITFESTFRSYLCGYV